MRKSSRVIIFSKYNPEYIYLMFRRKNDEEYYVIPGGGIENGESSIDAVKREAIEEIGAELSNIQKIDHLELEKDFCSLYTATELSKFEPTGEELKNLNPNNYYEVQLHKITNVAKLNLKPDYYQDIIRNLMKEKV